MSSKPRLDKALDVRRKHPFQQFGQSGDVSTFGGATGCAHTSLQNLALIWKGRFYTHDDISRMTGYPWPARNPKRRGLNYSEVRTFLAKAGLPYKVALGMSSSEILSKANLGPVMFGHAYSWVPEWYGFHYNGRTADGKPNGYAKPLRKAGKTQLSGFTGAHASVLLGYLVGAYVTEPNHGSPARPEKPPYDLYTIAQFRAMYDSYRKVLGRTAYAVIPTKGLR